MAGQAARIPKFGDWMTTGGGNTPYTMYFEDARKQRNMGGTATPPPPAEPPLAHGSSLPPSHRADANPPKPKDPAPRRRNQSMVESGGGSVPAWGQWNERGTGGGTGQQYTLVFDQIREERRWAPSMPDVEQLPQVERRPAPSRIKHRDQGDHAPKGFTCFGLCLS